MNNNIGKKENLNAEKNISPVKLQIENSHQPIITPAKQNLLKIKP